MQGLGARHRWRVPGPKVEQFCLYAKETMLFAGDAETDQEKQTLFDLARIWTQAALLSERPLAIMAADLRPAPDNPRAGSSDATKRRPSLNSKSLFAKVGKRAAQ